MKIQQFERLKGERIATTMDCGSWRSDPLQPVILICGSILLLLIFSYAKPEIVWASCVGALALFLTVIEHPLRALLALKGRAAMLAQLAIRRASESDLLECAELVKEWMDSTVWLNRRPSFKVIKTILRETSKQREIWVAGDPIDAYCAIDPATQHICALYCRHRGLGIGKELIDRAKEGRNFLTVNTHVPNLRAQRFYHREGFLSKFEFDARPPETVRELRMEWAR